MVCGECQTGFTQFGFKCESCQVCPHLECICCVSDVCTAGSCGADEALYTVGSANVVYRCTGLLVVNVFARTTCWPWCSLQDAQHDGASTLTSTGGALSSHVVWIGVCYALPSADHRPCNSFRCAVARTFP